MKNLHRGILCGAFLGFTIACGLAQGTPTHQLIQPFEITLAGQVISLPVGTEVAASPGDGKSMMVRHTLAGGSTTLLFIPTSSLKPLAKPVGNPSGPVDRPIPNATPAATPTATPAGVTLTTLEGVPTVGRILRVEPRYAVVVDDQGTVTDLPIKSLDKTSLDRVVRWKSQMTGKAGNPDPRLIPGKKFDLVFPDLGQSRSTNPARIQIRVPENFRSDKPSPIALYLAGGEGGDNCDPAGRFVDTTEWITVAFPYPAAAPRPLYAFREGKAKELIAFQTPMLERIQAIFPNTDPKRRVVIGSSNGAHMIGIATCDGWKDFAEYFSAFVLHEGGGSEGGDFGALRRKDVYVLMGGKSDSLGFAEGIVARMQQARVKPDVFVAPDEGHGMGEASRNAIRDWIARLPAK